MTKENKKSDLCWILPEIMGDLYLTVYVPIMLLREAGIVGILTVPGMLYTAVVFLLLTRLKLQGLREFFAIKWKA